ncbi:MAG TPA: alpha/beta fold hydrolase [Anaerolineales bacterium]|nr:alpha/beta fold hydrolase [Anaerolineales bacterium]HRK88454.1 alpha/beta fold hydrolase [Anaerolineales bacterium]
MKNRSSTSFLPRLAFPLLNMLACMMLGMLIGVYVGAPLAGLIWGAFAGLAAGGVLEWTLSRRAAFYRWRIYLCVALEISLVFFVIGPYAFVLSQTKPDPHPVCCETPLDYGAAQYERLHVQTGDGITLAGWYVPPEETPGAVIILLHGAGGDRRGTAWHARQLIDAGYGIFLYDQRALGESTGTMTTLGWKDGSDLLTVADFLAQRPEVDRERIGAVGLSLGGHIALNAARLDPDRFAALWLDGIQAQQISDYPAAENFGEEFATLLQTIILKMAEVRIGQEPPPPFIEILPTINDTPTMIVMAGQDDFERRVYERYTGGAGASVEFWLIENAHHTSGPALDPDEYRRRMLDFFQAALTQK